MPSDLQKTVEKAMSPRRKARPQNIEEFLGLLNPQMEEIDENTFIVNHEIETADITPEQQTENPITPIKVRDEESQDLPSSAKNLLINTLFPYFSSFFLLEYGMLPTNQMSHTQFLHHQEIQKTT